MWKMQGYVVISALTLAASVVNGQNEGCGLAVLDKCYRGFPQNGSTPDILVETVGEIPSVEECQWFCKELYSGECTWFAFDSQTNQCNIFKGSITDYTSSCELVGYPKEPNVADCSTTLTGDDACYNFREGYCRFEDYVILENLQFVQSLEHCQEACRHRPDCKFFLYEEKDKVCHLEGTQKRNCDVVHGLPNPPFGDCLSANKIPFTVHASLNATAAISTATSVGAPATPSCNLLRRVEWGNGNCIHGLRFTYQDGTIQNWCNANQGKGWCPEVNHNYDLFPTEVITRFSALDFDGDQGIGNGDCVLTEPRTEYVAAKIYIETNNSRTSTFNDAGVDYVPLYEIYNPTGICGPLIPNGFALMDPFPYTG